MVARDREVAHFRVKTGYVDSEDIDGLEGAIRIGPRRALALEGNPETRQRMERAGVEVFAYRGDEISRKGDGGPTCLTRPLLRRQASLTTRRR